MIICTSKHQNVKIENQKCKNRKFENAKIENLKNQRVLEGGECWAPHPPFACQREVPKFSIFDFRFWHFDFWSYKWPFNRLSYGIFPCFWHTWICGAKHSPLSFVSKVLGDPKGCSRASNIWCIWVTSMLNPKIILQTISENFQRHSSYDNEL